MFLRQSRLTLSPCFTASPRPVSYAAAGEHPDMLVPPHLSTPDLLYWRFDLTKQSFSKTVSSFQDEETDLDVGRLTCR